MPKDFEELQCWQLAHSPRKEVYAICAKSEVSSDFKFCSSLRDTAASICRNLSEGFTRFTSPSIVLFFGYALGSIAELKDHFADCLVRQVIDQAEYVRLIDRANHVKATALNFMRPHVDKIERSRRERLKRNKRRRRRE